MKRANVDRTIKLYRSPVRRDTLEPKWEPFVISTTDVGGLDAEFNITCFDWEKDGAHVLVGSITTNLREFSFGPVHLPFIHPEKAGR